MNINNYYKLNNICIIIISTNVNEKLHKKYHNLTYNYDIYFISDQKSEYNYKNIIV